MVIVAATAMTNKGDHSDCLRIRRCGGASIADSLRAFSKLERNQGWNVQQTKEIKR